MPSPIKKCIQVASAILLLGLLLFSFGFNSHTSKIAPYRHPVFYNPSSLERQISLYEAQLKTNPDGPFLLTSLAASYVQLGKQSGNFDLLDRAERMAKKSESILRFFNDGAKLIQADVAQAKHNFRQAIQIGDAILKDKYSRGGSKIDSLAIMITSDLALGDLSQASVLADRLVDLRPAMGSYVLRALVMTATGRNLDALNDFQIAYKKEAFGDPVESTFFRTMWGKYYMKLGHYAEARDLLNEATRILPSDHLALGVLGDLDLKEGRGPDAEIHFSEAFTRSKQMVYLLGEANAKSLTGDQSGATEIQNEAEKILRSEIKYSGYGHRSELVRLLLGRQKAEDFPEALKLAKEEVELRGNSEMHELCAWALGENGHWVEAREEIQKALRTGIQDPEVFSRAHWIEDHVGNPAQSAFYASRLSALSPN